MKSGFQRFLSSGRKAGSVRKPPPTQDLQLSMSLNFALLKIQQPFGEMLKGLFPADNERTPSPRQRFNAISPSSSGFP